MQETGELLHTSLYTPAPSITIQVWRNPLNYHLCHFRPNQSLMKCVAWRVNVLNGILDSCILTVMMWMRY